ncbi:MAG TPA: hypothetical protein H9830_08945, partial [Candidatus Agrococcus pullicola]|nr:hypothetical protein [Candidatus Agrococcus pullicola]
MRARISGIAAVQIAMAGDQSLAEHRRDVVLGEGAHVCRCVHLSDLARKHAVRGREHHVVPLLAETFGSFHRRVRAVIVEDQHATLVREPVLYDIPYVVDRGV